MIQRVTSPRIPAAEILVCIDVASLNVSYLLSRVNMEIIALLGTFFRLLRLTSENRRVLHLARCFFFCAVGLHYGFPGLTLLSAKAFSLCDLFLVYMRRGRFYFMFSMTFVGFLLICVFRHLPHAFSLSLLLV